MRNLPDKIYSKLLFRKKFGYKLNFKNPVTFNEKLQWLKLYDRKDIYTTMVDKYEVKKYVANIIGEKYVIPTLGLYNKFEDINFDKLPNQFVIKCTHDSGGIVICKNKKKFDIMQAKEKISRSLSRNFYYYGREWPYKNVRPRIIIEKYMEDESKVELKDYKIFCFNGEPKLIMVDTGRFTDHKRNVYDIKWNKINMSINFPNDATKNQIKPKKLEELVELSRKLSYDIPFVRTDFYIIKEDIYFGELTFFPGSGFQSIQPVEWQEILGSWLNLPKKGEKNEK